MTPFEQSADTLGCPDRTYTRAADRCHGVWSGSGHRDGIRQDASIMGILGNDARVDFRNFTHAILLFEYLETKLNLHFIHLF